MLMRLDVEFLIRKRIISCVCLIFRPHLDGRRKTSWYEKERSINSGSVGHLIFGHRDRETWYQYGNRWSSKGLQNKAGKHGSYWFTSSWAVFQFTVTHLMLSAYLYGPRLLNSHVRRFISAPAAAQPLRWPAASRWRKKEVHPLILFIRPIISVTCSVVVQDVVNLVNTSLPPPTPYTRSQRLNHRGLCVSVMVPRHSDLHGQHVATWAGALFFVVVVVVTHCCLQENWLFGKMTC